MGKQNGWRWCHKCQGLFFSGNPSQGACPTGGAHDASQSGHYAVLFGDSLPGAQSAWRWCHKCQGFFYSGNVSQGACPASGAHDASKSGHYSLQFGDNVSSTQSGWRWCFKCQGLFFAGNPDKGTCSGGGKHDPSKSGHYGVPWEGMFRGRTFVDSHGAVASPALTTWNNTLVMVWCGEDGTIYFASAMEQTGIIAGTPLPQQSSLERPALFQFEDRLVLAYIGTDNQIRCALSFDGQQFNASQPWVHIDQSLLSPCIGGPAIFGTGNMYLAWTEALNQNLHFGFTINPPTVYEESVVLSGGDEGYELTSVDTPALALAPTNDLLLAFAGPNTPGNNLTVQAQRRAGNNPSPLVVYDDLCFGGPALVTTTDGFAAAYAGKNTNIYLLYGVENLDNQQIRRTKLQDTSWHAPALVTLQGITYVAWIGTDGPSDIFPTGSINFADLGSMPVIYANGSG